MKATRNRAANKPGSTAPNARGGYSARHQHKPAGSKLARFAREGRITKK